MNASRVGTGGTQERVSLIWGHQPRNSPRAVITKSGSVFWVSMRCLPHSPPPLMPQQFSCRDATTNGGGQEVRWSKSTHKHVRTSFEQHLSSADIVPVLIGELILNWNEKSLNWKTAVSNKRNPLLVASSDLYQKRLEMKAAPGKKA